MKKKVNITEVVLRDANQSQIATRMPRSDFEDILETMDKAGYYSMEVWGGATFDSCLRYLDEDPWDRLRFIRSKVKNTKLQMLLRGQNILGYRHYSDDTVRAFVRKSVENGIDIIRIFDALNDPQNMATAIDECIKAGGHAQGTICYTTSPVHTFEKYVELGKKLESMGCHSLCIKDMAGIMSPKACYDLVTELKKDVKIPVYVHSHTTTGLAPMTLLKAIEADKKALIVLPEVDSMVIKSANNIPGVKTAQVNTINVYDILNADKLIIAKDAVSKIEEVYA